MEKIINGVMPHMKIILYIVVFVVCFGLAIYLFSQGTYKKRPMPVQTKTQNTAPITGAWMKLEGIGSSFTVGQTVTFSVIADSNQKSVTGYDLLFLYDPTYFQVQKVTSLDPTIDVFTFNNPRYISVTGTKKLSVSALNPFASTQILSIQLQAKKMGQTTVAIASQMGRETTKLVDNKANIVTPSLEQPMNISIK